MGKEKKRRASVVAIGGDPNLPIDPTTTTTTEGATTTMTDPENVGNNGNDDDKSVNSQGNRKRNDDEKPLTLQSTQTSGRRNAVSLSQSPLNQVSGRQNKTNTTKGETIFVYIHYITTNCR